MKNSIRTIFSATLIIGAPTLGCTIVGPNDGTQSPDDGATEEADAQAASASRIRESVSVSDKSATQAPRRLTPKIDARPPVRGSVARIVPLDPPGAGEGSSGEAMALTKVVPSAAAPGSIVAIYGEGFGDDASALSVTVGGGAASVERANDGEILAVLGADVRQGSIEVRREAGRRSSESSMEGLTVLTVDGGFARATPSADGALVDLWPSAGLASGDAVPDFSTLGAPAMNLRVPDLNLSSGPFGSNLPGSDAGAVAAQFKTVLFVESDAEYELCVEAEGAARLLIEGFELAVATAGGSKACGAVGLAAGGYSLQVEYVTMVDGAVGLDVSYAFGDNASGSIPGAALSWIDVDGA